MIQPTAPKMPGAIAAQDASQQPLPPLPPLPPMGGGSPNIAPPPLAPPPMTPLPSGPDPMDAQGAAPPYITRVQSDGSIVAVIPSPDGDPTKDVIFAHFPAPKLPKALQQPPQQAPSTFPAPVAAMGSTGPTM